MADGRTDRELLDATRAGDAEAFGRFVRRHQQRVHRLAMHFLASGTDAEDVTQEAFALAYGALDRFDGRSEPFTWLYRITVNASLNLIRSQKRARNGPSVDDPRVEALLSGLQASFPDPGTRAAERELAVALANGIDSLSESLRTTLILVTIDGLSQAEASEVLGCPPGTVAWRVHEARKRLREFLAERGHTDHER